MAESAQPRVAAQPGGSGRPNVLTSYDPRTGETVGSYAVMGAGKLNRTVRAARAAEKWWS